VTSESCGMLLYIQTLGKLLTYCLLDTRLYDAMIRVAEWCVLRKVEVAVEPEGELRYSDIFKAQHRNIYREKYGWQRLSTTSRRNGSIAEDNEHGPYRDMGVLDALIEWGFDFPLFR